MTKWLELIKAHPLFTPSRIPSLYSNFERLKETNPDGYAANVQAWLSLLLSHPGFVFEGGKELLEQLARPEAGLEVPLSIDLSLDACVAQGDLMPLSGFVRLPLYQKTGWVRSLFWWYRGAAYTSANGTLRSGSTAWLKSESYVNVRNLERLCGPLLRVITDHHSGKPWVVSTGDFFEALAVYDVVVDSRERETVLTYLSRDLKICVVQGTLMKFSLSVAVAVTPPLVSEPPQAITEHEVSMEELTCTVRRVEAHERVLEQRIAAKTLQIKTLLQAKRLVQAKLQLQAKRHLLRSLEKTTQCHHQLLGLLTTIEESSTNLLVVQAMKQSQEMLNDLKSQTGTWESIDRLMNDLSDDTAQVEEVSLRLTLAFDAIEVDHEFDLMVKEEALREERTEEKPLSILEGEPPSAVEKETAEKLSLIPDVVSHLAELTVADSEVSAKQPVTKCVDKLAPL